MKIYLASSWRNPDQPTVLKRLRHEGFEVYDFRNPHPGNHGFHWSEIDTNWENWTPWEFIAALKHEQVMVGFSLDFAAMNLCDVCVLVMPCGRSAHLELGYMLGQGKPGYILLDDSGEPELMYRIVTGLCTGINDMIRQLKGQ